MQTLRRHVRSCRIATAAFAASAMTITFADAQGVGNPNRPRDLFAFPRDGAVGHPHDLLGVENAAVGDVNGDGFPDVYFPARANHAFHVGEARLILGDGDGGFVDVTDTHVPSDLNVIGTDAVLGDLDGDQDLDAVVFGGIGPADRDIGLMSFLPGFFQYLFETRVYLNDGTGRFSVAPLGAVPIRDDNTLFGTLFDADRDGDLDIYQANQSGAHRTGWVSDGQNRLLINDGSGRFSDQTATRLPDDGNEAPGEYGLVTTDVDGDGDVDVVTTRKGFGITPGGLVVDLNDGSGHFTRAAGLPGAFTGTTFVSLTAIDVDRDGRDELLVTYRPSSPPQRLALRLLGHDGNGFVDRTSWLSATSIVFPETDWLALGDEPLDIAPLDVDSDGDEDALLQTQNHVYAFVNDGRGQLRVVGPIAGGEAVETWAHYRYLGAVMLDTFPVTLHVGDFDVDGCDEVLVVGTCDLKLYDVRRAAQGFRLVDRLGGAVPTGLEVHSGIAVGDVDGDGDVDWIAPRNLRYRGPGQERERVQLALNDGLGGFELAPLSSHPSIAASQFLHGAAGLELADVDGDGDLDLLGQFGSFGDGTALWRNDGTGSFGGSPAEVVSTLELVRQLVPFDADGDGDVDLVILEAGLTRPTPAHLYLNDGSGAFAVAPGRIPPAVGVVTHLESGDVDGDGDVDLVAAGHPEYGQGGATQTRVWLNDGSGAFADAPTPLPADRVATASTTLVDVDGDADLDLVLANWGLTDPWLHLGGWGNTPAERNALWLNDGSGAFTDASNRLPQTRHHSGRVLASDFDGDGDLDLYVVGDSLIGHGPMSWWKLPIATRDSNGSPSAYRPIPDLLWLNDGSGRFVEAGNDTLPADGMYRLDVAAVDFDRDDDDDLLFIARAPVNRALIVANRQRHLEVVVPPRVGGRLVLRPWHVGSRGGGSGTGVALLAAGTGRRDTFVPGVGWLRIDPSTLVVGQSLAFQAGGGQPEWRFRMPSDPTLIGGPVVFQAVFVDASGASLSNAIATAVDG